PLEVTRPALRPASGKLPYRAYKSTQPAPYRRAINDRAGTTMTLTELKYIVTLAQERHFGRAAEKCFVSQPTLSVAIKKLESELDIAIFERSKSSVSVTPLGERIVQQAQRVLEEARVIKERASSGKDQLSTP